MLVAAAIAALLACAPLAAARTQAAPPGTTDRATTAPATYPSAPASTTEPTLLAPLVPPTTSAPSTAPPATDAPATTGPPSTEPTTTTPLGGDGTQDCSDPAGGGPGQVVPSDAATFIGSLPRSAPNDDEALVQGERDLLAAGYAPADASRLAYGHFPVAGPAHWTDDWLAPRFSCTQFRYHYGIDVIAAYGTPLHAPEDGTIGIEETEAGGLTVQVILPDHSFYEMAHMSAVAPGIAPGMAVKTGDLVGYVGATGDATGPHLHLGFWKGGVTPQSTKAQLDQWAADAAASVQRLLHPPQAGARSLLGTAITRDLTDADARRGATDLLVAAAANPAGGALQVAKATAARAAGTVDWARRADEAAAVDQAWSAALARAWAFLAPLTPEPLRAVLSRGSS